MKIEIRNLKIARSLSEETTAYTATIVVDGVPTFAASNHGTGGCDFYARLPTAKVTEAEVDAWLAVNVAPDGPYEADPVLRAGYDTGHTCDLEVFVGRVISEAETAADVKRITKKFDGILAKSLAALRPDGTFSTFKAAPAAIAQGRVRYPDYVFVNDAPKDGAVYRKALLAYCPDLATLAPTDYDAAVRSRSDEGTLTLADARYLLAQNGNTAAREACLRGIIAAQETAEAAYRAERDDNRMQVAARDAAGAVIGHVS